MAKIETAQIGDVVWWYPDLNPDQMPFSAVVTGVGISGLCLHIISQELRNFRLKDGVRHIADSSAKAPEIQDQGCWRHTDRTRKMLALLEDLQPVKTPEKGK
jgi:hypothetical protein